MVVRPFRDQRDLRHEAERLGEIGEDDGAADRIPALVVIPIRQGIERLRAFGVAELIDHRILLPVGPDMAALSAAALHAYGETR